MFQRPRAIRPLAFIPLATMIVFAGCASTGLSSGTAHSGPTVTATPVPCSTHATSSADAWVAGTQVAGSIAGGATATLSNFTYPLGITDENAVGNAPRLSYMAWAPDGLHLAVAATQDEPFETELTPFIVDTTTHAVTKVSLPNQLKGPTAWVPVRLFAWADAHTLIIFGNPQYAQASATPDTSYSYDITTHSATPLSGMADAIEGAVRCSTVFYLTFGPTTPLAGSSPAGFYSKGTSYLNRYSLATNSVIGTPIALSDYAVAAGGEGAVDYAGWDVSPDGTRIVYQHMTAALASGGGFHNTSQWFVAHADGSGPTSILGSGTSSALTANTGARLRISPDGAQVAVTNANPSPNVASGPLAGGATIFYDAPASEGWPAWKSDSSGFYAETGTEFSPNNITLYTPPTSGTHTSGTSAVASASNVATLP